MKKRQLTIKQKIFVREAVRTKNPKKAAIIAYELGSKKGSKTIEQVNNTAAVIAHQNMNKPAIREALDKLLMRTGITRDKLAEIHLELLESVDEKIRLQSMVEAHKLLDSYPSQKIKIGRLEELEGIMTESDVGQLAAENERLRNEIVELKNTVHSLEK